MNTSAFFIPHFPSILSKDITMKQKNKGTIYRRKDKETSMTYSGSRYPGVPITVVDAEEQ